MLERMKSVYCWRKCFESPLGHRSLGAASTRDVKVAIPIDLDDEDQDENADDQSPAYAFHDVRLADPEGVAWPDATELATTGDHATWAATIDLKKGAILAFATDDLLTNAGLARPPNAAALIALLAQ